MRLTFYHLLFYGVSRHLSIQSILSISISFLVVRLYWDDYSFQDFSLYFHILHDPLLVVGMSNFILFPILRVLVTHVTRWMECKATANVTIGSTARVVFRRVLNTPDASYLACTLISYRTSANFLLDYSEMSLILMLRLTAPINPIAISHQQIDSRQ